MRAHLCQLDLAWEDTDANHRLVDAALRDAAAEPGDLVVLPEMFDSGFSLNVDQTWDQRDTTLEFLRDRAARFNITIQGSRTLRDPVTGRGRNMATILGPDGRLLGEYAKIHPFSFGREPEAFDGGQETLIYRWAGDGASLTAGVGICYDLRFPELFRRLVLVDGAEVLAIGANWPAPRQPHWRALLIARAIENQALVLGVNRCGDDPHLRYAGGTIAVDPKGEILGELSDEPGVLTVEVDPEQIAQWRRSFPALTDARLSMPAPQ